MIKEASAVSPNHRRNANECENGGNQSVNGGTKSESMNDNPTTSNLRKMNEISSLPEKTISKTRLENLIERYHQATASKLYDVEELIDFYFHRRLAAVIAVIVSYLPFVITPNQITIFGLIIGWLSGLFLYDAHFHTIFNLEDSVAWFLASFLMFAWIVSDCADGQVARLCKRGTRTGRILDGVVDGLVIAPNLYIVRAILADVYGEPYQHLAVAGGVSLWFHAIVYDKIKNVYMEHALPESECAGETVESVRMEYAHATKVAPFSLDCFLLGIYYHYLHIQSIFTTMEKETSTTRTQSAKVTESRRIAYVRNFYYIARLASFIGISAHVTAIYVAYGAAYFWRGALVALQFYFLVVLNAICIVVLILHAKSGMCRPEHSKARIS